MADKFTYKDYIESEKVKQAQAALDTHNAAKPLDYQSKYGSLAEEAANAWANRDKFTYDLNGDALYQQYKDKYIQQGRLAMQDTIGQASAMTGGYGNSYAATAGNQAYQASLQNLNDIVPQLYQMAYDQYNQEGQDMLNRYNLYNDMENQEYSRYRDTVSDWTSQRDYLANTYNNERTYDRSIYDSDKNFAYGTWSDDRNYAYQVERDRIADEQWQKTFDESIRQYNETMAYNKSQKKSSGGGNPKDTAYELTATDEARLLEYKEIGDWEGMKAYIYYLDEKNAPDNILDYWSAQIPDSNSNNGIAAGAGAVASAVKDSSNDTQKAINEKLAQKKWEQSNQKSTTQSNALDDYIKTRPYIPTWQQPKIN